MTLKVSVGFKAWLDTTDDSRPLSDYRTVLEGTIIQIDQLEDALDKRLRQEYMDLEHEFGGYGMTFEEFREVELGGECERTQA